MHRITPLHPSLDIWRRGNLRLDQPGELLGYFWAQSDVLITRDNINDHRRVLVEHPQDILKALLMRLDHMVGMHLYRITPEQGCVSGMSADADPNALKYCTNMGTFRRPAGSLPVEVTYLGTVQK